MRKGEKENGREREGERGARSKGESGVGGCLALHFKEKHGDARERERFGWGGKRKENQNKCGLYKTNTLMCFNVLELK